MIKRLFLLVIMVLVVVSFFLLQNKSLSGKSIILIVETRLALSLKYYIERYKSDLEKEGYSVIIEQNISASTSPLEIRKFLQEEYNEKGNLIGAVFVGNIPAPLYNEKKHQGDIYWHDYLSDLYYMDLNGIWKDNDNNGVYDQHSDTQFDFVNWILKKINLGNKRTPEIWISRLRTDMLNSLGDEVSLLKKYFDKNHAYRTGKLEVPPKRAFVVSSDVDVLKSDWGARPFEVYSDVKVAQFHGNLTDTLRKFLSSDKGYELGIISVFSGPRIHHFNFFKSGLDTIWQKTEEAKKLKVEYSDQDTGAGKFTWLDVKNIKPKVLFYHLLTSQVGRHNYPDYLAGTYIFTGLGLLAIAGTQHSGAVGTPILYEDLKSGKSFGDAWKNALTWEMEHSDIEIYWHNGDTLTWNIETLYKKAVLIGDGTLRLPVVIN